MTDKTYHLQYCPCGQYKGHKGECLNTRDHAAAGKKISRGNTLRRDYRCGRLEQRLREEMESIFKYYKPSVELATLAAMSVVKEALGE